jgi:hypothetical protein
MSDIVSEVQRILTNIHPEAETWVQSTDVAVFLRALPAEAREMATFIAKMAWSVRRARAGRLDDLNFRCPYFPHPQTYQTGKSC